MKPDNVAVNRKVLRELLVKSFSYEELNDFCFDYFPEVYDRAEGSFGKHVTARLLIDHCERRGLLQYLISLIAAHNPYQFTLYEAALFKPAPAPVSAAEQPQVTLKLTFPTVNIENFTPAKQAALIHLIAEELNISEDDITIVDVKEGSTIIILRLPASAAKQLMALYLAEHPVLVDLRLGHIESMPVQLSLWVRIVKFLAELSGSSNLPLLLIATGLLLAGLAALPLLTSLRQVLRTSENVTPTPISEFIFVTATATPLLPAPTPSPTVVPAPTFTEIPPSTPTATVPPTIVFTPTSIPTTAEEPTTTATFTPSETHPPTPTETLTATPTPTETYTPTPSQTPTPTPTPTYTPSFTPTATKIITITPSSTPTLTPSSTPTLTSTPSPTPGENQVTAEGPDQVEADQLFTAVVAIKNIIPPGVFGAQFSLVYEPEYLAIVDLTPNPELLVIVKLIDNQVGQMDFAASRREGAPNFTEDVIFVTLTFKAKPVSQAVAARIKVENVKLGAKGGIEVPATTRDLTIVIRPGSLPK
ncbi:MAG: hypothetical protein JW953_22265 [Anaerolineae bacterium]|nr:hypothetical protein [Anaerolineae bacterium]